MADALAGFARPQRLVETDWVAAHLGDTRLLVFDCTTHLVPDGTAVYRVESGQADWERGHIPGSGHLDIQ